MADHQNTQRRAYKTRTVDEIEQFRRIVEDFDTRALGDYFQKNQRRLQKFANQFCSNPDDGADFLMETFEKVLTLQTEKKPLCDDPLAFDSWFHTVLKHHVFWKNSEKVRSLPPMLSFNTASEGDETEFGQNYAPDAASLGLPDHVGYQSDGFQDPLLYHASHERETRVAELLRTIQASAAAEISGRKSGSASKQLQNLFLYANGQTYSEIAEERGIPLGTVRSSIANSRKKLLELYPQVEDVLEPV